MNYFIVAETKNGRAFPYWAKAYTEGGYARAVLFSSLLRRWGARAEADTIKTDADAAKFEEERSGVSVLFIQKSDAAEWLDPNYPNAPVMKKMIGLGWVTVTENDDTGIETYALAKEAIK